MSNSLPQHETPAVTDNLSAAEYVQQATKLHQSQKAPRSWFDRAFYPAFSWIGDAMLSVAPINRISSAMGLTLGLTLGGASAHLLAGQQFDGKTIKAEEYSKVFRPLHGVMKFDPLDTDPSTKLKKFAMYAIFSLGGALGVAAGTKFAYRSTYKKNRNPEFLEDYDARVSQEQGDRWTPLTALSAIFGSSSGFAMLPVPGLNYAVSLSSRTTLMQNRNNMTPGLHKWMSGTKTSSTLSIREGLQDLIQYAVHNPSQTPELLELKSFHILTQLFPEAKAKHIKQFVGKIHELRDPYWVEGGVSKDKKKALEASLTQHFTKAGFETTLVEIGLNPRAVNFTKINGALGRIANSLGGRSTVEALQREYDAKLLSRHPDLPKQGHFLPTKPMAEITPALEEPANTVTYSDRAEMQKKEVEPRKENYKEQHAQEKSTSAAGVTLTV